MGRVLSKRLRGVFLGVRTHTIEEAIRLFKVWFLNIRNKELKVYKVILESVVMLDCS